MERSANCRQTSYFDANNEPIYEEDILELSPYASVVFNCKYGFVESDPENQNGWKLHCTTGNIIPFGLLSKLGELTIAGTLKADGKRFLESVCD